MGDNIYAKIGDITGSATTKGYEEWCRFETITHGLNAGITGERDKKGGSAVGRTAHQEISFTKSFDDGTTELIKQCLQNEPINVEIAVVRETGGAMEEVFKYELEECFITSLQHSVSGGGEPYTSGTINYGTIVWTNTKIDPDGKPAGTMEAGWDRNTNEPK